ncbi:glycerophosphodiester phosphodiesterase [Sediminibacillus massiliensis]|uniref:glycerophosphodiester phosphodiesterase n=1 Tax=Sediminibacillus massiliensis TaxID=1926277 RepID=UPI0009888869|nr:glycerophosphodiester phosphodiesterase [Sediminibacillus massiliensis]
MKKVVSSVLVAATMFGNAHFAVQEVSAMEKNPLNEKKILNVAHRGASGYAPEHTIPAYELGDQQKGDYVEVDLQMTKDGELIAMHDEELDRTTNGSGYVKDYTLEEIKQLDAGSWFNDRYPSYAKDDYIGLQVPTLEEVIERFGRSARYYIETKSPEVYPGMEERLLEILEAYKLIGPNPASSQVIIQSFSPESLKKVHEMNNDIPLVQLISYSSPAEITEEELVEYSEYAVGLGMNYTQIDREYVEKVRSHNLLIHPYTVNEKEDMRKLLEWGVTGMFTNFPDRLEEVLKEN